MFELFLGTLFLIFAVILLPIILSFRKSEAHFRGHARHGRAVIVGYVRRDFTRWDIPQVSLEVDGMQAVYRMKSRRMNASTHPHNTPVMVEYCTRRALGTDFYDIRMLDPQFAPLHARVPLAILIGFDLTFLTVSAALFIIGLGSF